MRFECFVALRYLKAKRRQAAISVVTLISVLGVVAGVCALVVALAINNGFREELEKRLLGATANINLLRASGGFLRLRLNRGQTLQTSLLDVCEGSHAVTLSATKGLCILLTQCGDSSLRMTTVGGAAG
jgi:ABC-type lipoprotein release transport system permease subunit